jgi:hypothetical protein
MGPDLLDVPSISAAPRRRLARAPTEELYCERAWKKRKLTNSPKQSPIKTSQRPSGQLAIAGGPLKASPPGRLGLARGGGKRAGRLDVFTYLFGDGGGRRDGWWGEGSCMRQMALEEKRPGGWRRRNGLAEGRRSASWLGEGGVAGGEAEAECGALGFWAGNGCAPLELDTTV